MKDHFSSKPRNNNKNRSTALSSLFFRAVYLTIFVNDLTLTSKSNLNEILINTQINKFYTVRVPHCFIIIVLLYLYEG
jgi:hypothetical protein